VASTNRLAVECGHERAAHIAINTTDRLAPDYVLDKKVIRREQQNFSHLLAKTKRFIEQRKVKRAPPKRKRSPAKSAQVIEFKPKPKDDDDDRPF
jgi:hypothetical protein